MLTNNVHERDNFEKYPMIKEHLRTLNDGQSFKFDDFSLQCVYTPGHIDDHMSFLLTTESERLLIVGDVVLGSPSAVVEDLDVYLQTLRKLQEMEVDHLLLPHSVGMSVEDVCVPAKKKLADYIAYREERLAQLLSAVRANGESTKEQLYDVLYGPKNLTGKLVMAANRNLDLQIAKLRKDGLVEQQGALFKAVEAKL